MKKRAFTLFELLLVLILCAVALGSIGIALPKAIHQERFERSVELALTKISQAIDVSLSFDTDVLLTFKPTHNGVECILLPAVQLPEKTMRVLQRDCLLKDVEAVLFNGPLYFSAASGQIPRGKVTVVGKKSVTFECPGYPKRIVKTCKNENKEKAPYPKEALPPS